MAQNSFSGNGTSVVQVPDPEVVPKAKRRTFTAEYKLRIVQEAEACSEPGQIGALLRREGLYWSHLDKWRKLRARGQLQAGQAPQRGRKSQRDPQAEEVARLQRENQRLRTRLEQAELIIEAQKKLAQLLGLTSTETDESH